VPALPWTAVSPVIWPPEVMAAGPTQPEFMVFTVQARAV
jgi:hypothetical protein